MRANGIVRLVCWPALFATLLLAGCSAIVDGNATQCTTTADCSVFDVHATCNDGVCVASGLGPKGCFFGEPQSNENFLNQCSAADCEPFDNCDRLGICDGKLPALVPPPGS